jgi:hypothetical protein
VGASPRPDDDSVAEKDATMLFRVPRRAFFATRKGRPVVRLVDDGRRIACDSISIDPRNAR